MAGFESGVVGLKVGGWGEKWMAGERIVLCRYSVLCTSHDKQVLTAVGQESAHYLAMVCSKVLVR